MVGFILQNIIFIDVEEMGRKLGINKKELGMTVGKIAMMGTGYITELIQKKMREGYGL